MVTAQNFWALSKPEERNSPATEKDLKGIESRLRAKLPEELRQIYLQHNGGYHPWLWIQCDNNKLEIGLDGSLDEAERLWSFRDYAVEYDLANELKDDPNWKEILKIQDKLIVFAWRGSGEIWCLDYTRNVVDPEVVFYKTDAIRFTGSPVIKISSFREFLKACRPNSE